LRNIRTEHDRAGQGKKLGILGNWSRAPEMDDWIRELAITG
jgi:hypothetical protein